jgi:uncharacterized DUF497 family protein
VLFRIYGKAVEIEYDPAKDAANVEKHGISLARAADLDIYAVVERSRPQDRERRFRLYGLIDESAYCAVVTWREGAVGAISLRRANRMERKRHGLGTGI